MPASRSFGRNVQPALLPAIPKMPLVSPAKKPLLPFVLGQLLPKNLILQPSVNSPLQLLVNYTTSSAGSLQPVSPAVIPKLPLVNATDKSVDPSPSEAGKLVLKLRLDYIFIKNCFNYGNNVYYVSLDTLRMRTQNIIHALKLNAYFQIDSPSA